MSPYLEISIIVLLIGNLIGSFSIWLSIERRLSSLEGRFSQYLSNRKEVKT